MLAVLSIFSLALISIRLSPYLSTPCGRTELAWFGHIDCAKCGHRHPSSDDCEARKRDLFKHHRMTVVNVTEPAVLCHTFMGGFDDGPWLPGHGRARKRIKKSPEEMTAIRAKAWATRRNILGPKGHR